MHGHMEIGQYKTLDLFVFAPPLGIEKSMIKLNKDDTLCTVFDQDIWKKGKDYNIIIILLFSI